MSENTEKWRKYDARESILSRFYFEVIQFDVAKISPNNQNLIEGLILLFLAGRGPKIWYMGFIPMSDCTKLSVFAQSYK